MRTPHDIPLDVRQRQIAVSDPAVSAWVAANAGSGKTHVLAQRVINLLLGGVEPEKVLCITFTKAAAANMAKRVFDTLGAWTRLADEALDQAIEASGIESGATTRTLARRLFARALETPGGLKVQTIHAFCTQLLHQFPFEANVAARFSVLDDIEQTQMLEKLTLDVLLQGAEAPQSPLGQALAVAMTAGADQTFRDVVRGAIAQADTIRYWIEKSGGKAEALAALSIALGVDPAMTLAEIERRIVDGPILPSSQWLAVGGRCQEGSARDQERGGQLMLASRLSGREQVETYLKVFLDSKSQPRSNLLTQGFAKKQPALAQQLLDEQNRVLPLRELRNAVLCRNRSAALMTVAAEVLDRYGRDKQRRGLVDYDDLIDKALDLLRNTRCAMGAFQARSRHRPSADRRGAGHQHQAMGDRATAGGRVHGRRRRAAGTADDLRRRRREAVDLFVPERRAAANSPKCESIFRSAHEDSGLKFDYRKFEHSFRSGESVLSAVDVVFKARSRASVTSDSEAAFRRISRCPTRRRAWSRSGTRTSRTKREPIEGWDAPFDTVSEASPRVKLARRIARTRAPADRCARAGRPRPAAGALWRLLILVRQRG